MVAGDGGEDAGPPRPDGGAPPDAGSPFDAGRPPDAGVDAGFELCACPTLPETCTPPLAGRPTFTPPGAALEQLVDVIACAESTLRIAIYDIEWDCISGVLQTALDTHPDLTLEVVVDDRECLVATCIIDSLTPDARVTVVRDTRSALMHHKWVIADDTRLWVTSANFTRRSFCSDLNNAIVVENPDIIVRYDQIFDRMFTAGEFGPVAPEGGTSGGPYTVYFSPESATTDPPDWLNAMIAAIDAATTSVELMVFAWTRTEISQALVAAAERGVIVRGLVSGAYADDAPAQALLAAGIGIRVARVHSKVMVIDRATVVTGSANWSANAWSNNENSLWIDDPTIAAAYVSEFERVYVDARPVEPAAP